MLGDLSATYCCTVKQIQVKWLKMHKEARLLTDVCSRARLYTLHIGTKSLDMLKM